MSLRNSYAGKIYYKILEKLVISKLKNKGINPNKITLMGGIIAIFVPTGFYISPIIGTAFIFFSAIFDSIDGQLARVSSMPNKLGSFLDSTIDRISDFFYLMGFWVLVWNTNYKFWGTFLIFVALLLTLLFSYEKARIEGLGGKCDVGFMERAKRIVFLLILGIGVECYNHSMIILGGISLYSILLLYSVLQRIRCAKDELL